MKEYKKTGIYTITSPSGGQYVGSAMNFRNRWRQHINELRRVNHKNKHLQNAFNKHGEEKMIFKKIIFCDVENLILYEQIAMDALKPRYNIVKRAGSPLGTRHSEETKRKMSESQKKRPPMPEEQKRKISKSLMGHPVSESTRKKFSEATSGDRNSRARSVRCVETGHVFTTLKAAAEWLMTVGHLKAATPGITIVMQGKQKTAYGYKWEKP